LKFQFSEIIPQQLEKVGGMHVDFLASSREDQADYMFSVLDAINNK
jgi:hypothetical protein